jgi:hypothetical protein
MEQLVGHTRRTISQTSDLAAPPMMSVPASAPGSDGRGTFGAWVEQHYVAVALIGMVVAGSILSLPTMTAMTLKLGPVLAGLGWLAGRELVKRERLGAADVTVSLALVLVGATVMAAVYGA